MTIFDPMPDVTDFADTAAIIAHLDLVIAVDTAVAHLAGAMGKPIWLLSRFDGCWRWLTARTDSPWYPSLRLYRQETPGNWRPAIAQLAADLTALVRPRNLRRGKNITSAANACYNFKTVSFRDRVRGD
jgi:ADP-heptose:LPS heptosyltransferase